MFAHEVTPLSIETAERQPNGQIPTPENIIPQLTHLTRERVRALPFFERNRVYAAGLREFLDMMTRAQSLLCSYEVFRRYWEDWCGI